jgi:hypothetical protein
VLVTLAEPGTPAVDLCAATDLDHARVARANRHRTDVRVWTCRGGLVLLGRGLAGRWEVAVEVDEANRGQGLGRASSLWPGTCWPARPPLLESPSGPR